MGENNANIAHSTARTILDTFASVGATHFDITWTTSARQPRRYDEHISANDPAPALPVMLDEATARNRNLIVRPEGPRRDVHSA